MRGLFLRGVRRIKVVFDVGYVLSELVYVDWEYWMVGSIECGVSVSCGRLCVFDFGRM